MAVLNNEQLDFLVREAKDHKFDFKFEGYPHYNCKWQDLDREHMRKFVDIEEMFIYGWVNAIYCCEDDIADYDNEGHEDVKYYNKPRSDMAFSIMEAICPWEDDDEE